MRSPAPDSSIVAANSTTAPLKPSLPDRYRADDKLLAFLAAL
jgi:hypothetical protein